MKISKSVSILTILLSMSLLAISSAHAGYKYRGSSVTLGTSSIAGQLGNVRNTTDSTQYITCTSYSSGYVRCAGRSLTGYKSCSTTNAAFREITKNISSSSYIYINFNTAGSCTAIRVEHGSHLAPKRL